MERDEKRSQDEEELIAEALKVNGIDPKHVFASRVNQKGEAVIVTVGGTKVIHKRGDSAVPDLTPEKIRGVYPKGEMLWSDRLNQRMAAGELRKR